MSQQFQILAFFQNLGAPELLVIGVVALLLFGKRLPEVGRSLGKGIVEFKKGLRDTGEEINTAGTEEPRRVSSTTEAKKEEIKPS